MEIVTNHEDLPVLLTPRPPLTDKPRGEVEACPPPHLSAEPGCSFLLSLDVDEDRHSGDAQQRHRSYKLLIVADEPDAEVILNACVAYRTARAKKPRHRIVRA